VIHCQGLEGIEKYAPSTEKTSDYREEIIMKKGIMKAVTLAAAGMAGAAAGAIVTGKKFNHRVDEATRLSEKHFGIMLVLDHWIAVKQDGKNLAKFFEKNGYKKIAIYGMSYVGERLVNELKGSDIQVAYGIDKNAANIYSEVEIKVLEDDLEPVDIIVVTAVSFFDEIESELVKKVSCPVISIEDVLYEI